MTSQTMMGWNESHTLDKHLFLSKKFKNILKSFLKTTISLIEVPEVPLLIYKSNTISSVHTKTCSNMCLFCFNIYYKIVVVINLKFHWKIIQRNIKFYLHNKHEPP
jgi:hypothetical protein